MHGNKYSAAGVKSIAGLNSEVYTLTCIMPDDCRIPFRHLAYAKAHLVQFLRTDSHFVPDGTNIYYIKKTP